MFRHADARGNGLHAGPARGDSPQQIGMEQKRLDNLRTLGDQQPPETPGDQGKLPNPSSTETVDLNAAPLNAGRQDASSRNGRGRRQ